MQRDFERSRVATRVNWASRKLLEASEIANELKLFQISLQLLDHGCELHQLARELLELPRHPPACEQQEDLPF